MGRLSLRVRLGWPLVVALCVGIVGVAASQEPGSLPDRRPGEELVRTIERLSARRVPAMWQVVRIEAEGTARTDSIRRAKLRPFPGRNPPPDGIYEFAFTVVAANGEPQPENLTPVRVVFDWYGVPDNAAGIRVRAGANVIEARILPAERDDFDVEILVGRRVAANREIAEAGDIVVDDLPQPVRVIHGPAPPDDHRPDRLTLEVDDKGVIVRAYYG